MKLNKIVGSVILLSLVGLFSGCSSKYKTVVLPMEDLDNVSYIRADQDATNWSITGRGDVLRTNYKYSFAIAAKTTINKGYKYFSIYAPVALIEQFQNRKVKNVIDAYNACDNGDGSFRWFLSTSYIEDRKTNPTSINLSKKRLTNNCDNISYRYRSSFANAAAEHSFIFYHIHYHNEDRQDYNTFNAQEILDSEFINDLNPAYFIPMKR